MTRFCAKNDRLCSGHCFNATNIVAPKLNPASPTMKQKHLPLPAKFVSRADLCSRYGISRATSYRLEAEGKLPKPRLIGCQNRWSLDALDAFDQAAGAA